MKRKIFILLAAVFIMTGAKAQQAVHTAKLSPYLSSLANEAKDISATSAQEKAYDVLVLLTLNADANIHDVVSQYEATAVEQVGRVYFVSIPVTQLAAISLDERIERIEANPVPTTDLDTVQIILDGEKIYSGQGLPQAYDGTGVVAGILDTGLNFIHPMFLDKDGNTRVKYCYDIPANKEYTTREEVQAAKASYAAQNSNEYHGTHVMGIMAGSRNVGTGGKYSGIASGADICGVDFTAVLSNTRGTDSQVLLGFKKIFDWAEAQGKPCVINMSASGNPMPRNPYTLETEVLEGLIGPGRIIVTSVGNQGASGHYLRKEAGVASAGAIGSFSHSGQSTITYEIDLRTETPQTLYFCVPRTSGSTFYGEIGISTEDVDAQGEVSVQKTINSRTYTLKAVRGTAMPETWGKYYEFTLTRSGLALSSTSDMALRVEGEGLAEVFSSTYGASFTTNTRYTKYNDFKREHVMGWPSDRDCVIGVGALGYRYTYVNSKGSTMSLNSFNELGIGKLASFSNRGPGLYGNIKPDVTAPGVAIRSAYNNFDGTSNNQNRLVDPFTYNGTTYNWLVTSGTSQATPAVAGTIAIWLQAKPDLTVQDIREIIAKTATYPDTSMDYPNNLYGYGQIDMYKGLLYVLDLTNNIQGLSDHMPANAHFELNGKILTISYGEATPKNALVSIYTTDGKLVLKRTLANGEQTIDLSALNKGVYAVQLNTNNKATTGSTLIRL